MADEQGVLDWYQVANDDSGYPCRDPVPEALVELHMQAGLL